MKISRLFQVVLVSTFVAAPALGADAPISLCGEHNKEKAEKTDKTEQPSNSEATVQGEKKKNDNKKEAKDQKESKGSA